MTAGVLVIDIGTSSVRSAVVQPDATVAAVRQRPFLPATPAPGLVEFDPAALADAVLTSARDVLAAAGPVGAVGIANQRASTVVWERATGKPVAPGIGWQDLRTLGTCLTLQGDGLRFAPNQSATKLAWLLDTYDADRSRDLCFGTLDSWVIWILTGGRLHVTDRTNAGVTGLICLDASDWDVELCEKLRVPTTVLPTLVDSTGVLGEASELPGAPPLAGLAGDQQASLIGQGCVHPGMAKLTFGSGGFLDVCIGPERPAFPTRGPAGCFPVVTWGVGGRPVFGVEAILLTAGTCIEWLRDDLGIIATAADSDAVAAACADAGGVVFVPALLGLGTPHWDYGARGTLLGLTRGSGRAEVVRAVLEGIAHRGADLIEAAEADSGGPISVLRVDGGMSANATFVQALADATGRAVEVSPVLEATTLGAGFLAGLAIGTWRTFDDIAAAWRPSQVVDPRRSLDRNQWRAAVERAGQWIPDLSAVDF